MLGVLMAEEHRPHPPSARKLRRAREQGDVPRSPLASAVLVLLAGGTAIALVASAWIDAWRTFAARAFGGAATLEDAVALAARGLAWPLAAVVAAATIAGVLQAGPLFTAKPLSPDLSRLDPAAGLRRIFAPHELASRLAPLALVVLLGALGVLVVRDALPGLVARPAATPEVVLGWAGTTITAFFVHACAVLVVGGAVALAYRRHRYLRDQSMSRRELRQEQRETEGEPAARRRRARRHRELAMGPSLTSALATASLVVRGVDVAVVISWPTRDATPVVAFVARGHALESLVQAARGVARVRDDRLARALASIPPGADVRPSLFAPLAAHFARSAA